MKRVACAVVVVLVAVVGAAAAERNVTPERVDLTASGGYQALLGRFDDHANGGPMVSIGALFQLTDFLAPALTAEYSWLAPQISPEQPRSLDAGCSGEIWDRKSQRLT